MPTKSQLRIVLCAAVLVWVSDQIDVTAAARQSAPTQSEVQFFLTALAKDGSPTLLQEAGLSVLIDKTAAQVRGVRSAKDDQLLFAVLIDVSRSDAATANSIKEAAAQLFQGLASGQNQGYLVLFNHRVAMSQVPLSVPQAKKVLDSAMFGGGTAVYDAIEQSCEQKLSRSGNPAISRRVIVLISDGEDNQSHVTRGECRTDSAGGGCFGVLCRDEGSNERTRRREVPEGDQSKDWRIHNRQGPQTSYSCSIGCD